MIDYHEIDQATNACEIRDLIQIMVTEYQKRGWVCSPGKKGIIGQWMNRIFPDGEIRHLIYGWLFHPGDDTLITPLRLKILGDPELLALYWWISPVNVEGDWLPRISFQTQALWIKQTAEAEALIKGQGGQLSFSL
mgnify:CR=1 FL=1